MMACDVSPVAMFYLVPCNLFHVMAKTDTSMKDKTQVSVEDLALHKESNSWVSCLGFVIAANSWFSSHKGRDITTRVG